jgi:hypothetical protein
LLSLHDERQEEAERRDEFLRELAGKGKRALDMAAEVGVSVLTVRRWQRYRDKGVEGLPRVATRPSRKKPLSARDDREGRGPDASYEAARGNALEPALHGEDRWRFAKPRIWKVHGLKSHPTRTFKLSRDPDFSDKVADVVASISIRPSRRWFSRLMRRARYRRSIEPGPADEEAPRLDHDA